MHNGYKKPVEDLDRNVKRAEIARIKAERDEYYHRNLMEFEGDGDIL